MRAIRGSPSHPARQPATDRADSRRRFALAPGLRRRRLTVRVYACDPWQPVPPRQATNHGPRGLTPTLRSCPRPAAAAPYLPRLSVRSVAARPTPPGNRPRI